MSSRLVIITLTHQTIPVILDSSSQPNQRPFKKQSFTSLIQRTALTIWRIGAGKMASCVQPGVQRRSVFLASRSLWQCKTRHPKAQFSIKVGTIFEDSPIGLDKWLLAMWQMANCKNGISSWEIHRATGVSQKTAWFMLQRIRLAPGLPLTMV
jgi:transposase-like protein